MASFVLAIIWYHNNKALINGERYRIVTKEEKSALYIKSVNYDDFGYYICKAINDAGEVLTRTKLIESVKAYMIEEDIEEAQKKVEKKLSRKIKVSRKASLIEENSSSSVNFEATVKSKKSKSGKKSTIESVNASATIKNRQRQSEQKMSKDESSQLTISRNQILSENSSDSDDIEIINDTIQVSSKSDLETILETDDFNSNVKSLDFSKFHEFSNTIKEFFLIIYMIEKGVKAEDIKAMFSADFFPLLKTTSFQSALIKLVEKSGHGDLVSEILSTKSEIEIESQLASSIGLEVFLKMIIKNMMDKTDIFNLMEMSDFNIN